MKKLSILLLTPAILLFFTQCGGPDNSGQSETENAESEIPIGTMPLDLSGYGYPLTMYVPDTVGSIPDALAVIVLESGALEIRVGIDYQVLLNNSEGNLAAQKEHIQGDDVYESTFLVDEKDAIYYTSTIKGFGLDTTYHFFMIIRNGDKAYEIEDIKGEQFDQWAGDQMYELVSATKINPN